MTKIECVVKDVSDLRDFYLRLQRDRTRREPSSDRANDARAEKIIAPSRE
ncbi:MAG: hypothetical protein WEB58_23270 [Planctomycetaceae bacterium]